MPSGAVSCNAVWWVDGRSVGSQESEKKDEAIHRLTGALVEGG